MGLIVKSTNRNSAMRPRAVGPLVSFNHDGVEIARRRPRRREWPVRQVVLFLVAVLSFKIFLFFDMGGGAYGAKVEELGRGNGFERIAARAMALDPVSRWLVDGFRYGRW